MLKFIFNTDEENVLFAVINYAKKQQGRLTLKYLPQVITYHTEKHHSNSYALSARKSLDIKCICNTLRILCLNTSTYIKHSFSFIQTFVFRCGIFSLYIHKRIHDSSRTHLVRSQEESGVTFVLLSSFRSFPSSKTQCSFM